MQYFFILGRNPELSAAELHAVLPSGYRVLGHSREALVVECAALEVEALMRRLGGTVKMGEILSHNTYHVTHNTIFHILEKTVLRGEQKLFLGLSAYALDDRTHLPTVRELRGLGMEVKRALQDGGHKVRLVTARDRALSSVIVKKEKLLAQGAEIVLMYGRTKGLSFGDPKDSPLYTGQTLAVQEFEEASIRDFGRPVREMRVGILPIQLAKIMINLARVPLGATLLDPFCGFGTILAEAMLMGYTNLIGSDLEQSMVDATRENLEWLQQRTTDYRLRATARLFVSPAEELSKHLPPRSVDAIVTEPHMGPTREIRNSKFEIRNLVDLYIAAFHEFSKILKPGGRVVFIFPAFKSNTTLAKTSDRVLPEIKKLGFEPTPLLPNFNTTNCELKSMNSITYSRPDQRVLREIFVFEFPRENVGDCTSPAHPQLRSSQSPTLPPCSLPPVRAFFLAHQPRLWDP